MDIRITSFPKIRLLARRENDVHSIALSASAATTEQVIKKLRPGLIGLYSLRRRFATVSVALLAGWLLVHVMFGANGMMVYRAKRAEVQSLQREIDSLKIENDRYGKQINDLRTDPKTIEKEAREQLHYARPGEVVYVAPAPASPEPAATNAAQK